MVKTWATQSSLKLFPHKTRQYSLLRGRKLCIGHQRQQKEKIQMHSKKCFGFRAQECPSAPGLGDKRIDLFTVKVNSSSFLEKKRCANEYCYMETENQRLAYTSKSFSDKAFCLLSSPYLDQNSRAEKACACILSSFYLPKSVLIRYHKK